MIDHVETRRTRQIIDRAQVEQHRTAAFLRASSRARNSDGETRSIAASSIGGRRLVGSIATPAIGGVCVLGTV